MKKRFMGRLLGLTLAMVMGISAPISAYAAEEVGELSMADTLAEEEIPEDAEEEETADGKLSKEESIAADESACEDDSFVEDTSTSADAVTEDNTEGEEEEHIEDCASDDAEEANSEQADKTEYDSSFTGETGLTEKESVLFGSSRKSKSDINLAIEFIGFGDEADAFIAEQGEDAYEIDAARYSDEEYYLDVVLKMQPFMTNAVLEYVTCNDKEAHPGAAYYSSYGGIKDCFGIDMGKVPVEYLSSGETLRFYAHWTTKVLSGFTLCANGGVFDDAVLFGGSTITYTVGDSKSITPVEGNDNNVTVEVTYNSDKTVAYVPVMQDGFMPLPQDNEGVSMDLAGRPYESDRLPLLGWNTRSDGSGEFYMGEQIPVEKTYWNSKETRLDKPVTLYAIFPEYYGAEFILDGESYVGDYWTEKPNATHTESIENLFALASKGSEDKFVKEGYTLSWFLNEDCTIPADFTTMLDDCRNIKDRLTVYGQWKENVPEVKTAEGTVTLANLEGAVAAEGNNEYDAENGIKLEVGQTFDLSKYLFTRNGYTFKNWTATVGGKTKTFAKNAKITKCFKNDGEELTFTANWTRNNYKITYALSGAKQAKTAPKNYNVEEGAALLTPAKTGFVFKGWDIKRDGKAVTDPEEIAAIYDADTNKIKAGAYGNLALSAKMVPFGYKILFHVEGVTDPIELDSYGADEPLVYTDTVNFNNAAIEIEDKLNWHETMPGENNPYRDLKIVGFSKTEGGKADFDRTKNYSKLTSTEEEVHLYAVTQEKTYEINYHLDEYSGATLTKPIYTFKSGNKKFALPKATCPGYKFYGWEFNFSRNSDRSLFYSYVRMCTPYECDAEFALTVAQSVNNDIEVRPYFVPNRIKIYVSPNGSGVYEDVSVETSEGTDFRPRKVTGKRAFGVVNYGSDSLYSDWYDETMDSWYRPGYEFVGYSKNPKATSEDEIFTKLYYGIENFSNVATSGSGTIYCIWKKSEITIDNKGATVLDGKEVISEDDWDYEVSGMPVTTTYGKAVTLPKAEMEGYEFLGWKPWTEDDKLGRFQKATWKNGYIISVSVGNCYDLDVYPVFRRCRYDLYVNTNGGTYGNLKNFRVASGLDYSDDVSVYLTAYDRNNVTRKGYRLMGFALDKKGETGIVLNAEGKPLYNAHSLVLKGNKKVTLYAVWKKI